MKQIYLLLLCTSVGLSTGLQAQTIRYVKQNGTGNGASWQDASGDLQLMINASVAGDRVYVAEGTYMAAHKASNDVFQWLTNNPRGTTNDKAKTFVLKEGVAVYGGFSATAPVTDLSLRDFDQHVSLITTDVQGDDAGFDFPASYIDNHYHAVVAAGLTAETIFDGFSITGGTHSTADDYDYIVINGVQVQQGMGGGLAIVEANVKMENIRIFQTGKPIYMKTSTGTMKNITITNSYYQFEVNGSVLSLENLNFSDNLGNLRLDSGYTLPIETVVNLKNATFARNTAGAIRIWRDAQKAATLNMDKVAFLGNQAPSYGVIQNNGGHLRMSNSVASGNTSGNQSGFLQLNTLNQSIITHVEIVNSTIVSNYNNYDWQTGTGALSGLTATNAHVQIVNSIIWGNKRAGNYVNMLGTGNPNLVVSNSIIQDAYDAGGVWNADYGVDGGGNSGAMPAFTQYIPMGTTAFSNGDLSLQPNSAGINAGSNTLYNTIIGDPSNDFDLAGNVRLMGSTIDMGAYEFLEALSVTETPGKNTLVVYPNPASDKIYISGADVPVSFEMYNMAGQRVLWGKTDARNREINVGFLRTGTYVLKVENKTGIWTQKIIKK